MGSWNKTCGLTNLPIFAGEQTLVFVLEREHESTDNCYATHLYRPLLLPFESTYNDYGGGENSGGAAFSVIMNGIRDHLVEIPQGENPYHDIAVTGDQWGEELFFDAVHENRLRVKTYQGDVEVTFVMMRCDVVDNLIESHVFEEYVGRGKGNHGYQNSYVTYRVADVVADIDDFFQAILRIQQETKWSYPRMDMMAFRYLDDKKNKNRAAAWVQYNLDYRYSKVVRIREHIMDLLLSGDSHQAKLLMIDHIKGMFVDQFMHLTRKTWIPGGHEGSQSQDYDAYRSLVAAMNTVMDARDKEYGEYDDDEEA